MTPSPAITAAPPAPSRPLILTLAAGAGFAVASLYYAQPVLQRITDDLHLTVPQSGLIPTLTQIGYAAGIFLLLPLGDRYDRRTLIVLKALALALMLGLCSLAPGLNTLLLTSFLIGVTATMAQDIVPAASILAPAGQQGRTIGTVMTGLTAGILLSRTVSGVVGEHFGWRAIYLVAAALLLVMAGVLWRMLPRFKAQSTLSYPALLLSLGGLWKTHPPLRRAALTTAVLSVAFSAFWSTLALMLHQRHGLGSDIAGAFGLAGAAGAIAARMAGALSDRIGTHRVTRLAAGLVTASFLAMGTAEALPMTAQLAVIAFATVTFDLGFQSSLVAHQTLVYSLDPAARGRLNAVLFTVMFSGMALGSVLGTQALALAGWPGVIGLTVLASGTGLLLRLTAPTPVSVAPASVAPASAAPLKEAEAEA